MSTPHKSFSFLTLMSWLSRCIRAFGYSSLPILIVIFTLSLIVFGCQSKTVTFDSFETKLWLSDTSACRDYRNGIIKNMEKEFDKFIGMSETELVTYLGSPDKTLLYTRGQKFFSYTLSCEDSLKKSKSLRIRFSALDYVNEVLILD